MKLLILLFFLFSCSPDQDGYNDEETHSGIKKINLNGANSIIYTDSKNDKSLGVSSFSSNLNERELISKNVIGLRSDRTIAPIEFVSEGIKEDDAYEIERIAKLNDEFGYASINNQNYIFELLSGAATRLLSPVRVKNVPINESPVQKYKGLFYFKKAEGVFSTKLENGEFSDFIQVDSGVIGSVEFFEINNLGIIYFNKMDNYYIKDLNGVLNNGEVFSFGSNLPSPNGRNYSSIGSGGVFLSENEASFIVLNNGGLLVELHTMTESGVDVVEITNTRYFRLHTFHPIFHNNREYCKKIPNTQSYVMFCYVEKEKFLKDTGSELTFESVSNLFINGDTLVNIPLYGSLGFTHTSACESYGDCGANNNHTYFGFYTIDAFDMWGNYFVACGEEKVEYSSPPELLGKRCILYDVRTRKLKSELNEIVDNNTFTVDHVLFEDEGDILFYGSDYGSEEKKFKLSTHNEGTWSTLQDTVVDFDQYIDKILRF